MDLWWNPQQSGVDIHYTMSGKFTPYLRERERYMINGNRIQQVRPQRAIDEPTRDFPLLFFFFFFGKHFDAKLEISFEA